MIGILRKNQQTLLIVVTILVIISFGILYNTTQFELIGADRAATIYGRTISKHEIEREARKIQLANGLGLRDYLMSLSNPQEGLDAAILNSMVVDHEADRMQIEPSDNAVAEGIQQLPAFQTNGAFDFAKYSTFVENQLSPLGFSKEELEELVRDDLRVKELKKLIGATATVSPEEIRAEFERRNEMIVTEVIRLDLSSFIKAAVVSEDDVKKAFADRKDQYMSDEKRKIRYVRFALTEDQKALESSARIKELQKLADAAQQFSVAMVEPDADFSAVAAKAGVDLQETEFFSRSEPPAALANAPAVVAASFELSTDQPDSDAIQAGIDSFYVVELAGIEASEPLSFEQAKEKVTADLKQERGSEAMNLKAAEIRRKILEELQAGKSFAEAVKAAGATAEMFPKFSASEPNFEQPDSRAVMMAAFDLKAGDLSEPVPTAIGVDLVYLKEREPVSNEAFEKQKLTIQDSAKQQKQELFFHEWLRLRRAAADVKILARR